MSEAVQDALGTAAFTDEEMVIHRAKVFRAGDYPDKDYSMTPEELIAATIDFQPVPVDYGHPTAASPLDGKLGHVQTLELDADGQTLMGSVAIPKWLDDLLGDGERKVSAAWNRATKRLEALSLVTHPRIPDAALYAAFARQRHDTPEGQSAIQTIHDVAARSGAVCKQANATMSSAHEATVVQQAHDLAVQHGATCSAVSNSRPMALYSAEPAPLSPIVATKKGGRMSWLMSFKKAVDAIPDDAEDPAVFASTATQTPAAVTPTQAADPRGEIDGLRAELQRERAKGIARDAAAFATRVIEISHKAFPAEKDAIINAYTQAAQDDIAFGVATFATGQQGTRVSLLEATYEGRPSTAQLTSEMLNDATFAALTNRMQTPQPDPNAPLSAEGVHSLLAMTATGRAELAARNGTRSN